MIISFKKIFSPLLFAIILVACGDDNADEHKTPEEIRQEKMAMLAGTEGKSWLLSSAISGSFDFSQMMDPCEKDNLYVLFPEGSGEYRVGDSKCEEDEPDLLGTGSWELSDDSETLTLNLGIVQNNAKVLEITANRLQLEFSYQNQTIAATFIPAD